MPNPFEEHFSNNPRYQPGKTEYDKTAEQAARGAAREIAERAASERKKQQYEQTVTLELERYEPTVIEVLEQLRDALYPEAQVISERLSYYPGGSRRWPANACWRLSFVERIERFGCEPEVTDIDLCVGISLQDTGEADSFILSLSFARSSLMAVMPIHVPLTREALVKKLLEIHTISLRSQAIIKHNPRVTSVLERLEMHPSFKACYGDITPTICPNGKVDEGIYHPLRTHFIKYSKENQSSWLLTADLGETVPPSWPDVDGPPVPVSTTIASVSLIFDEAGDPSHYDASAWKVVPYFSSRSAQGWKMEGIPLEEEILFTELERAFRALAAGKSQKKRKGWFSR